jgi:ESF2/ABP1 family protein
MSSVESISNEKINDDNLDNINDNDNLLLDEYYILNEDEHSENILENNKDYKEKVRRTGVIYLSHIPDGMNVNTLREKLSSYNPKRIYLVPDISSRQGEKRQSYKEGWVEFEDKILAKLCEYELNGRMIGGKKRKNNFREDIWTIKYLHKFKWHHLMEKVNFNKKIREQRMKAEVSQARRENQFMLDKFEQSRIINRLNKKRERDIEENPSDQKRLREEFDEKNKARRAFKQKKPLNNNFNKNK